VIVLAGFDREQGVAMAEVIRQAIADARFLVTQDLGIRITVSCGVATAPADAQALTELLSCADQALFASKAKSGNAVTAYPPAHG